MDHTSGRMARFTISVGPLFSPFEGVEKESVAKYFECGETFNDVRWWGTIVTLISGTLRNRDRAVAIFSRCPLNPSTIVTTSQRSLVLRPISSCVVTPSKERVKSTCQTPLGENWEKRSKPGPPFRRSITMRRSIPRLDACSFSPCKLSFPRFSRMAFEKTRVRSLHSVRILGVGLREVVISIIKDDPARMRRYGS